ncbi:MAG TPA: hypothetical protein VGT44_00320, partial [Ktedonobacteraceae bacterium]|nr:hypothetical protein [Ktedonobacteraceae bacterium]
CGSFEQSGAQLLSASCTPTRPGGCRGPATGGPSAIRTSPATGGAARTIYSSQSQAFMTLHAVDAQTLLLYIENTQGDLSQNGLWKLKSDGTGLTRLTTVGGQLCSDLGYPATWPQITSNSQFYALRQIDPVSFYSALQVGSLNGGAPTTFATKSASVGIMSLVGMVSL